MALEYATNVFLDSSVETFIFQRPIYVLQRQVFGDHLQNTCLSTQASTLTQPTQSVLHRDQALVTVWPFSPLLLYFPLEFPLPGRLEDLDSLACSERSGQVI